MIDAPSSAPSRRWGGEKAASLLMIYYGLRPVVERSEL
jgi:hypothetical protein